MKVIEVGKELKTGKAHVHSIKILQRNKEYKPAFLNLYLYYAFIKPQ